MKKSKQIAVLAAAREKWVALAKGEKVWKALLAMVDGIPAKHRASVVARLRERAASRPNLLAVVNAIAKTLRP